MKLSPGFCVILTTMRSDSTVVPPVTADRSPPDSRMTGADSPVMADSSTEAMPSTTSPSPGMTLAGLDHDDVALLQQRRRDFLLRGRAHLVSSRRGDGPWWRSWSCAATRPAPCRGPRRRPRPGWRKSTVSHSHTTVSHANHDGSTIARIVLQTAPISTMNMTGLRHSVRGSSLRSASGSRLPQHLRVEQAALHALVRRAGLRLRSGSGIDCGCCHLVNSFSEWAEREHRQEGQGDQDQGDAGDHADELRSMGGQRAERTPACCPVWPASRPAPAPKTIGRNRPNTIAKPRAVLYHSVLTLMPAKAEPLLLAAEVNAYSTSDSPCGPVFSMPARWPGIAIATAVPVSTISGVIRKYAAASLISRGLIFLPRYSGVRPTIRPATNTVITAQDEHAVQAGAGAAGRDLAELHVEHRDHAAEAGVGVVERVDRAGGGQRRRVGEDRRVGDAEPLFDTFHRRADRRWERCRGAAAGTTS